MHAGNQTWLKLNWSQHKAAVRVPQGPGPGDCCSCKEMFEHQNADLDPNVIQLGRLSGLTERFLVSIQPEWVPMIYQTQSLLGVESEIVSAMTWFSSDTDRFDHSCDPTVY